MSPRVPMPSLYYKMVILLLFRGAAARAALSGMAACHLVVVAGGLV